MNPFLNQNVIYYKLSDNFEASSLDPINMALGQSRCVCVCMCVCVDIEEVACQLIRKAGSDASPLS